MFIVIKVHFLIDLEEYVRITWTLHLFYLFFQCFIMVHWTRYSSLCKLFVSSPYTHNFYFNPFPCLKLLYLHTFDIVDTTFSYERELIVCSFLQDFAGKEVACNYSAVHKLHFCFVRRMLEVLREVSTLQRSLKQSTLPICSFLLTSDVKEIISF